MTKTYEELVTELRDVVRQLEDDGTGLDDCIRLYERGAVLVRQCEELLTTAELKIGEARTRTRDDQFGLEGLTGPEPFDELPRQRSAPRNPSGPDRPAADVLGAAPDEVRRVVEHKPGVPFGPDHDLETVATERRDEHSPLSPEGRAELVREVRRAPVRTDADDAVAG